MLNETWRAWKALETAEIPVTLPHPLIKPLPVSEKNLLRVRLNDKGSVETVEDVAESERISMRRILQTNDGSFPVIKVNLPFLDMPAGSTIWRSLVKSKNEGDTLKLLVSAFTDTAVRTWTDAGWNWRNSLKKASLIIEKVSDHKQGASIVSLAKRFQQALESKDAFISEIATVALSQLRTGRIGAIKTVQELLIGKGKDNRGNDKKISVLLALELDKGKTIYLSRVWQTVADVLPTNLSAAQRDHEHNAEISAFGGDDVLLEEPFPQVKLPILGSYFPLLSMASDGDKAKCNKRYGLTEYTTCPVTSIQSRRMAGALEWLVTREEGTTWRGVASGKFEINPRTRKKKEKKDLLIVFVEEKPNLDAKTASYFGRGAEITESKFEIDAKAVCDALDAVVQEHPKSKLVLFLIRKASDGQAQIALAKTRPVKDVLGAASQWQQAVQENTPIVTLYLQPDRTFDKKNITEVKDARPQTPYPDQVVRLLSYHWVRDGSSPKGGDGKPQKANQAIVGPGLGDVLTLMMRIEGKWESVAHRMLDLLIRRVEPMLIGLFGAKHAYGPRQAQGRHEPFFDYSRPTRETALRAVSVLGILLDALTSRKEDYMKDAPYQVGQVLALADTLHKDYCIVVRRGQLPNSLIGTSLMRRALDNPAGALADLSERMIEYVRWAKTAQISRDWQNEDQRRIAINEARKKLRQFQPLAERLGTSELSTECNDLMKAQLLLGFLASPPDEEQTDEKREENL